MSYSSREGDGMGCDEMKFIPISGDKEEQEEKIKKYYTAYSDFFLDLCTNDKDADACYKHGMLLQAYFKDFNKAAAVFEKNCMERKHGESCNSAATLNFSVDVPGMEINPQKALKLLEEGCKNDDPGSCNNAGLFYSLGNVPGVGVNGKKAEEHLKKACEMGGFVNACFNLSSLYLWGVDSDGKNTKNDIPITPEKALKYACISCDGGHLTGCIHASRMYDIGLGIPVDKQKAREYRNKSFIAAQKLKEVVEEENKQ